MAVTVSSDPYLRIFFRLSLSLLFSLSFTVAGHAQTATYHLHREASTTANLFQLKTAGPDAASLAVQSANLKNVANGEYLIKEFDTQSGVPNASGVIAAGSTVTFSLWLKKTASQGTMYPRVKLNLNSASGASVCLLTGSTALTTTLTKYTLTGSVPANVSMTAADRFYSWVGINLAAGSNQNNLAELDIEGSLNGNYDSQITVPLPAPPPPSISSLSPSSGTVATSVTVAGTNFGATQGTSTVTFNGTTATPTSWSATSIVAPVPSGATTGAVVVTVNGQASNAVTFTVTPKINSLSPTSGGVGDSVTISGSTFGATQGTSTVTFNGTTVTPTSWSATSIVAPVPSGATTGTVVVTVNGQASNGVTFTVTPKINSLSPTSGAVGASVTIAGTTFGATQGTSTVTFNGTTATPTSWSATSIVAPVPAGSTTGPVVVTAGGQASNGIAFTITATGTIAGTTTRTSDGAAINGALVEALQGSTVKASTTSAANGSYTLSGVEPGTYDVRASATGYQTGLQSGVVVTMNTTTTVNLSLNAVVSGDTNYIYDELGRLVAVVTPAETVTYTYDAVGNLLSISRGSSSQVSIIEFTPNGGPIGTTVTIYGTAFSTTPSQNAVTFNGVTANVTSATATQIVTTVPVGATTGTITVTTPGGSATSSTSFIVGDSGAPTITGFSPTIGPAGTDVTITGTNFESNSYNNRVEFNQSLSAVTSGTSTMIATTVPSAAASGRISVGTPAGTAVSSDYFFIPPSPYTVADVEVTGRMAIGEDKLVAITQANKIAIIVFDGVAGQRVSVGMSGVTMGTAGWWDVGSVAIYRPNGTVLLSPFGFTTGGNGTPTQVLPVTGTYSIVVDPSDTNTGSVTLSLLEDLALQIGINGPPVTLNFNRVGQNARLTFDGTAGQRVSVGISGVTIGTAGWWDVGSVAIYKPDGAVLLSPFGFTTGGNGTPTQVLPVTGTYSIVIDPYTANTGSATITLSADVAVPISINGPAVTLDFNRTGQNAWLTFDGSAGQRVSVGVSGVTIGTAGWWDVGSVAIYKPDGTVLLSPFGFTTGGNGTPTQVLPVTGTYSIVIDPYTANTGSATVTLSEDLSPPININGPAVTLDFRVGQNARLTFDGTAGQRVSVGISGVTIGTAGWWDVGSVAIYKPDGAVLLSPFGFTTGGNGTPTQVLPVTGTYSIVIDPYTANTGSATITLSADVAVPISINGPAVTLDFNRTGQNAWLTFDGSAGQRVSAGLSGITMAPGYCCEIGTAAIYKPDGTVLLSALTFTNGGAGTPSQVLPVTGSYSILVDPYYANVGNITLTLSDDLSPSMSINAAPLPLDFSRVGQNAYVSFNGNASQQITVRVANNTLGDVTVKLLKPDGTQLTSTDSASSSFNLPTQILPVTGTYTISIDPPGPNTGGLSLTVEDPSGDLALNKTATQSSTNYSGTADRAVDGNTDGNFWDGSVTHTQVEAQAWWHVDLGSIQTISRIDLWNRTDCCSEALTDFYVFVSDQPFASTDVTATQNQAGVWTYHNTGQAPSLTPVPVNRTGRYIRVQLGGVERLSLAEVQVWQ